ncbi:hypothetical protein METP3_03495 [Methanosarcinales archaeon]|nr:hypothetical protein METP3_03495 [Methanosarcinales archaeon]
MKAAGSLKENWINSGEKIKSRYVFLQVPIHVRFLINRNNITIETIAPKISNPNADFISNPLAEAFLSLIFTSQASILPAP